jgi:hypothetical protein
MIQSMGSVQFISSGNNMFFCKGLYSGTDEASPLTVGKLLHDVVSIEKNNNKSYY